MTIKVGVAGAGGRMGSTVCRAVALDPELELVAAVDPTAAGRSIEGVEIHAEPRAFVDAGGQLELGVEGHGPAHRLPHPPAGARDTDADHRSCTAGSAGSGRLLSAERRIQRS